MKLFNFFKDGDGELGITALEAGNTILELAETIQKESQNSKRIEFLVKKIPTLINFLCLPEAKIISSCIPVISIAANIISLVKEKRIKNISNEDCILVLAQEAYIKSFIHVSRKRKPGHILKEVNSKNIRKKLLALEDYNFSEEDIEDVLYCFHESKAAELFNDILKTRLLESGSSYETANIFTQKVSRLTHSYFLDSLEKSSLQEFKKVYLQLKLHLGDQETFSRRKSLEEYLDKVIANSIEEPVFSEPFNIKELHIPLGGKDLEVKSDDDNKIEDIEDWLFEKIKYGETTNQVIFIQGGPGRGKSVLSKFLSYRVYKELYPIWIPILIRLRDIKVLEEDVQETLSKVIGFKFAKSDDWLNNKNKNFLFILDGFDELIFQRGEIEGLEDFLKQISNFQTDCHTNPEMQHQVIITGRQMSLYGIERFLPSNLEKVEISLMNDAQRSQWLKKWDDLIKKYYKGDSYIKNFRRFIREGNFSIEVDSLFREPLLLYLAGSLHRNGDLREEIFVGDDALRSELIIYQSYIFGILNQRKKESSSINFELTNMTDERLFQIFEEAGLCIIQSGGEKARYSMIEDKVKDSDLDYEDYIDYEGNDTSGNSSVGSLLSESKFINALATFPIASNRRGYVVFIHKILAEFMCAHKIYACLYEFSLRKESSQTIDPPSNFIIKKSDFDFIIYQLFGFGALSKEILDFVIGLAKYDLSEFGSNKSPILNNRKQLSLLFSRLSEFYFRWCEGEFIDIDKVSLPQEFSSYLVENTDITTRNRNVDIYTGINVFILLLRIQRFTDLNILFHPCGKNKSRFRFDKERLLKVGSYINTLGDLTFTSLAGKYCEGIDLTNASLRQMNLRNSDFSGSVLFLADLCRTDLTAASFKHANLENAYLRSADLKETDFRYANLSGADFGRAYLYNANLSFANLSSASLQGANLALARFDHAILKDITWDNGTHWYSCRGLHNVSDLPDDLSQDDDFCDALEFGKAIEIVESKQSDSKQLNRAIMICKEVARKVRERRGDSLYYHILNKFAWTCCLYNHVNMDVLSLALSATRNNKGNYLDTYAVTLIMYYGLGSYEKNDRFMEDPYSTPSQDAIDYLERALNSNDFQKLSYISSKKIIDRRMQWIEKLKSGSNPFNEQMLFTLLNEER